MKTRTAEATLAYAALAVVMTWPLASRLTTDLPADLGDPLFNCWVLLWTGGQALAALSGNVYALHEYWNGNIFHPEGLTIAYSEHLTPQMLQILPILAATDNVLLGYNLLFLSTFVLSGLGMFLLVRDLTGRPGPAFVAGLAFAFAPYRLSQFPHLQVLSSQWMPFVFLGLRRYFVFEGRLSAFKPLSPYAFPRSLIGATAALVVQGLSCGYYLVFFPPFVAAYCLYEMAQRGLLRNWRVWRGLAIAAIAAAVLTWPFVSPYYELRRRGTLGTRSLEEAMVFSADTWSFATAPSTSVLLGNRVEAYRKNEADGFAGITILALAVAGIVSVLRRTTTAAGATPVASGRRRVLLLSWLLAIDLALLLALFVFGPVPLLRWARSHALLAVAAALIALLAWSSSRVRQFVRGGPESMAGFASLAAIASALLALGPKILAAGTPIGYGPYWLLFHFMPGADGIRVPARFFMVMAMFLAVLAGIGAAALTERRRRRSAVVLGVACVGILAESWAAPLAMSVPLPPGRGYRVTTSRLETGATLGPIYRALRDHPGSAAVIEFPYADVPHDIIATYYSGYHRKRLINGYSGFFPEVYHWRANFLSGIPFDLDVASSALRASGATHAVVHENAFRDGRGHEVSDWLRSIGAQQLVSHGGDRLFLLKPR